jgi:hypothetical protein
MSILVEDAAESIVSADVEEHPDIAVSHESGWTLSAFPSGLLVRENVEADEDDVNEAAAPRHLRDVPRARLPELLALREQLNGRREAAEPPGDGGKGMGRPLLRHQRRLHSATGVEDLRVVTTPGR